MKTQGPGENVADIKDKVWPETTTNSQITAKPSFYTPDIPVQRQIPVSSLVRIQLPKRIQQKSLTIQYSNRRCKSDVPPPTITEFIFMHWLAQLNIFLRI